MNDRNGWSETAINGTHAMGRDEKKKVDEEASPSESLCTGFRGYNIVTTLSTFMSLFIIGGVSFTIGIYVVEFREEFKGSSGMTSFVGSIHYATFHFVAPFSSYLTHRIGFRSTIMIGGVVTSMGLFATAFATSFSHVIVTFSIITGTGIGIFFVPGLTIVSYIEEGRTLFNGIAASGVGAAMAKTLTKTDEAATLPVSLMGLAQIFGRIISGLIGQSRHVDTFLFYWICSFSAGLAAIVFPFLPSYTSLIIGSVFHSLLSSPANSIYQIVMLYFVDIPQLTIAFTHLTVQIGLGMMIGAPLAGWVYDITGDYGNSFYLGGAIIASGSLLLTWPYIKHRRQRSLPENVELAKRTLSFSSMFGSQVVVASKSERKDTRRYKQVDQKEDIG
ncbi:monocarboxylate transporter 2-like isoform X2 [Lineus longissimus]|uniref:monocarboxylate transporter 2-like isoform X2 n=1 Tax=Lineus longissimus TaxID=88925 RepID=UPI00315C91E3